MCLRWHIRIEPEWIPRCDNEQADYISRLVDYDDWMLNPEIFNMLDANWGPHTVDRFANMFNHQLPSMFGTLVLKLLMLLPVIGLEKITGGAHLCF